MTNDATQQHADNPWTTAKAQRFQRQALPWSGSAAGWVPRSGARSCRPGGGKKSKSLPAVDIRLSTSPRNILGLENFGRLEIFGGWR